jgi:hypothetical protein
MVYIYQPGKAFQPQILLIFTDEKIICVNPPARLAWNGQSGSAADCIGARSALQD